MARELLPDLTHSFNTSEAHMSSHTARLLARQSLATASLMSDRKGPTVSEQPGDMKTDTHPSRSERLETSAIGQCSPMTDERADLLNEGVGIDEALPGAGSPSTSVADRSVSSGSRPEDKAVACEEVQFRVDEVDRSGTVQRRCMMALVRTFKSARNSSEKRNYNEEKWNKLVADTDLEGSLRSHIDSAIDSACKRDELSGERCHSSGLSVTFRSGFEFKTITQGRVLWSISAGTGWNTEGSLEIALFRPYYLTKRRKEDKARRSARSAGKDKLGGDEDTAMAYGE